MGAGQKGTFSQPWDLGGARTRGAGVGVGLWDVSWSWPGRREHLAPGSSLLLPSSPEGRLGREEDFPRAPPPSLGVPNCSLLPGMAWGMTGLSGLAKDPCKPAQEE